MLFFCNVAENLFDLSSYIFVFLCLAEKTGANFVILIRSTTIAEQKFFLIWQMYGIFKQLYGIWQ